MDVVLHVCVVEENVVIPRHAACQQSLFLLDLKCKEIPHFVRIGRGHFSRLLRRASALRHFARARAMAKAFRKTRVAATVRSNFTSSSSPAQANSLASLPADKVPPFASQR